MLKLCTTTEGVGGTPHKTGKNFLTIIISHGNFMLSIALLLLSASGNLALWMVTLL